MCGYEARMCSYSDRMSAAPYRDPPSFFSILCTDLYAAYKALELRQVCLLLLS